MPSLPNSLALTNIADGALIVAADHRNNYTAIQTAVNGLITALSGGSAGQVLEALTGSSVDWNGGTYTNYTPAWTSTGTQPALGNATTVGRFARVGKMVHCYGQVTFGTTSTYGTGAWLFSLPVNAAANGQRLYGTVEAQHPGGPGALLAWCDTSGAGIFAPTFATTYLGSPSNFTNTAPWTWGSTDFLAWNLFYEAA